MLELRVDQGLSWSSIAIVLGRDGTHADPATVAKRFERLKVRLAEMLTGESRIS